MLQNNINIEGKIFDVYIINIFLIILISIQPFLGEFHVEQISIGSVDKTRTKID